MEQPDKNPVSSDKLVPSTRRKSIALSIFLIFTGFVSLLAALIGWGSRIFRVGNLFEKWDEISTILFYFSTGIIILLIERVYKKSQIPNEMKGGAIGLTLYVALNWAADFAGELKLSGFLVTPLYIAQYLASQFGTIPWRPIQYLLYNTVGSFRYWIELLSISWFSAIPFVGLGIMYASASKSQWLPFWAVILSAVYVLYCLWVLWIIWLMSWMS